jgi:hypothetical protein
MEIPDLDGRIEALLANDARRWVMRARHALWLAVDARRSLSAVR